MPVSRWCGSSLLEPQRTTWLRRSGGTRLARPGSSTLIFAAGVTTNTVTVMLDDDLSYEGNETFRFVLSGITNSSLTTGTNTVTITDDDLAYLGFVSSTTSVNELDGTLSVTVERSGVTNTTVSVAYATTNLTATSGSSGRAFEVEVLEKGEGTWTVRCAGREIAADFRDVDRLGQYAVLLDGRSYAASIEESDLQHLRVNIAGASYGMEALDERERAAGELVKDRPARAETIKAPMPGIVLAVSVKAGDLVAAGAPVAPKAIA